MAASPSTRDPNNLVWIDMEMTGLQPDSDRIIEIALLVTDAQLVTLAEGPVLVVHQPDEVLEAMDSWNKSTHKKSGLIERVRASALSEAEAERSALEFLARHVPANISTLKELVRRWKPELMKGFAKEGRHEAMADILESIEELKFYRKSVMTI